MENNSFKISDITLSYHQPSFVIAEVAQAHDGSLGSAHALIEAVSRTGVNAIKFQTHIADNESTIHEPWRVKFSYQDNTRFEYWKRMEFTKDQWKGLQHHALEKGLIFLSSPFSMEAFFLLNELGVPAWKVASGEINNLQLLDSMATTGKPILFSSGMSTWSDLDTAVDRIKQSSCPFAVFQCTTSYPCPPEDTGLNIITEIKERYNCIAGLSDHSGTIFPSLAAVALGAKIIEVHVAFSKDCFGPDTSSSLTINELSYLVEGIRYIEKALSNPINKSFIREEFLKLKKLFGKSVVANRDLHREHIISIEDLSLKKPGYGFPPEKIYDLCSRKLKVSLKKNDVLKEEHFEK